VSIASLARYRRLLVEFAGRMAAPLRAVEVA
jgi:hypothetical protein